jgi:asparagine synthase (glutamine-hydrolysing)
MCGICGVFHAQNKPPIDPSVIEQMTNSLTHRGPDDHGTYIQGPIGLGFTRLSIIDLNGGHQPMSNEEGTIWLVFNGEIWNYTHLRSELQQKGHVFRTQSDTETVIHAYEEYGLDAISHLHGMFGFALWDETRQRLLLARDRAGKKPLYYTYVNGKLLFASEIKALLYHPDVKREVNLQALGDFLSVRYVPGPATLFASIYKVLPGHWLLCEAGALREECYWDVHFAPGSHDAEATYLAGIRSHVRRAVEERMVADVPVGSLLSGGVDSSIITGTMSQLTNKKIQTFAVGFDHPEYSELPYARLVARHFQTEHHELVIQSSDLAQYWPLLTWHRDEPVSEPSDLGVYMISQLARQYVKVVLSGEGGDELFAGYPKYVVDWLAHYYHLLPHSLRTQLIQPMLEHLPYKMRKVKMAARTLSQDSPERWIQWFGIFHPPLKAALLTPGIQAQIDMDSSRTFRNWLKRGQPRDDLSAMLYLDTKVWLPDNLLMKSDKMTMAASLEARIPLLDEHLVEYAAMIPSSLKIKSFQAKYLLKRAFADMLPEQILTRKKMGFNVPTGIWFREGQRGLITGLLLSERLKSRGYFNTQCIASMLREHLEGKTNYQAQLFTLASLELWFRVFIDPPHLTKPEESVEELLAQDQATSPESLLQRYL